MNEERVMKDAFEKAGVDTFCHEIRAEILRQLQAADGNVNRAIPPIMRAVEPMIRREAEHAAANMKNPARGGHSSSDAHSSRAPAAPEPNDGVVGQRPPDIQGISAPSPSAERDGDRGQSGNDTQALPAPPSQPSRDGAGRMPADAQCRDVRPVREPNTIERRAAMKVAAVTSASVLDTFLITERQGSKTPVGDVSAHAWKRIAAQKGKKAWIDGREAEFATIMAEYVGRQAHVPTDAKTRDVLPATTVELAIQESARIADCQRQITSIVKEATHGAR